MHDQARREHNRKLALHLARNGLAVFPSLDKVPLPIAWQKLDTSLGEDDRQQEIASWRKRHGHDDDRMPVHVGSTKSPETVKKLWKLYPDAVPSISLGPSGLFVLDADIDDARNGPALLRAKLKAEGVDIHNCPVTTTQSGAEHIYFHNTDLPSRVSDALAEMYVQGKGVGNQVVAPGAIREDGKRYTSNTDHPSLVESFVIQSIPGVPEPVKTLLLSGNAKTITVSGDTESTLIQQLRSEEWPDGAELFDSDFGKFDLQRVLDSDDDFKAAWTGENPDHSNALLHVLQGLRRTYGEAFTITDAAAILAMDDCLAGNECTGDTRKQPGTGEYDYRDIARAFDKARTQFPTANGSAFGVVEGEDDEPEAKPAKAKKSGLVMAADLVKNRHATSWLVKKVMPTIGVGAIVGDSNVGKTFVTLDIANKLSQGLEWFGRKTKKVGVLYIPGEGGGGIAARCDALAIASGSLGPIGIVQGDIQFFLDGVKTVKLIVEAYNEYKAIHGYAPACIAVDTLASCAPGMDENSARDVGIVCNWFKQLSERLKCFVIFIHHTGKDADKGARGSTALRANIDLMLHAVKKGGQLSLVIDKSRDVPTGEKFIYSLKTVVLGQDEDGEDDTSCVVVEGAHGGSQVTGAAFGEVNEDDDAAGATVADEELVGGEIMLAEVDKKVADEIAEDAAREALVDLLLSRRVETLHGANVGWTRVTRLSEVDPWLGEFVKTHKGNVARDLKNKLFYGQPEVMTKRGWLRTNIGPPKFGLLISFEPKNDP